MFDHEGEQGRESTLLVNGEVGDPHKTLEIGAAKDWYNDLNMTGRGDGHQPNLILFRLLHCFADHLMPFLTDFGIVGKESAIPLVVAVNQHNGAVPVLTAPPHRISQQLIQPLGELLKTFGLDDLFQAVDSGLFRHLRFSCRFIGQKGIITNPTHPFESIAMEKTFSQSQAKMLST